MDTTSYLALSRQVALQRHMTSVANNLANATTTGYRAEHTLFSQVLERTGDGGRVAFVQDAALVRNLAPGPVTATGNPFDLAIDGPGYLTFATPEGPRYSRAGRLVPDATGQLVDSGGHPLLDAGGNPVVLAVDDRQISVAPDGTIAGAAGPIAQLALVTFADEAALEPTGQGLYRTDQAPSPAAARLVQGALEGSNVQPVLEMTTMLETVRAFEGAQKLLDAKHELERQTIERTIRAGG